MIGGFSSPRYSSIELFKNGGQLDVALTKQLLNNQLTIKVQGLDILKTRKLETSSNYLNLNTNYLEFSDTRRFDISVTYRFNSGMKFKTPKNNKSNTEEFQRSK